MVLWAPQQSKNLARFVLQPDDIRYIWSLRGKVSLRLASNLTGFELFRLFRHFLRPRKEESDWTSKLEAELWFATVRFQFAGLRVFIDRNNPNRDCRT